ncbi:MAG: DUF4232 domain-containing protein [Chloroflexi bacterium]|nr:DUF4232 domain-containing protein [Chloroflexota bacterium]
MKKLLLIFLLSTLMVACNRAASSPPATQPAVNFPTIAPESLPICQPSDLQTSSNSNNADGAIILGVTLTNKTKNICTLANPPLASLLDEQKKLIDLKDIYQSQIQTPPAPALVALEPGESVIGTLIWSNYCQLPPAKSQILRLELGKGRTLDIEITTLATPVCADKNRASTINVGPYSIPP